MFGGSTETQWYLENMYAISPESDFRWHVKLKEHNKIIKAIAPRVGLGRKILMECWKFGEEGIPACIQLL